MSPGLVIVGLSSAALIVALAALAVVVGIEVLRRRR